jgi:hypothetical protein
MSEERFYVEVRTTHNTWLGAYFKGKISEAIEFYVKRESFHPKQRHVLSIKIASENAKTIFVG